MKLSPRFRATVRIAKPVLLALLLAMLLLPGAALASPPPTNGNPPPTNNNGQQQNVQPPQTNVQPPQTNAQPPQTGTQPPQTNTEPPQTNTEPPQTNTEPPATTTNNEEDAAAPHPDAPNFPSADCIVTHAATPAQLCPIAGGLQYYFIGSDGSSQAGPYVQPFSELATLHTSGASVRLYTGSNPFTGKSVLIDYLPADDKLRVSTYYPDTMYDTDKPYTFTIDSGNSVTHEAW